MKNPKWMSLFTVVMFAANVLLPVNGFARDRTLVHSQGDGTTISQANTDQAEAEGITNLANLIYGDDGLVSSEELAFFPTLAPRSFLSAHGTG